MDLKNKTAVITGGTSGLGAETCRGLSAAGAKIAIIGRNPARGKAMEEELGQNARFFPCDATVESAVETCVKQVVEQFGAIHILCNVAGISIPGAILGNHGLLPMENYRKVMETNVTATIFFMRFCAEAMRNNPPDEDGLRGVIVNTSSLASFGGERGQSVYAASKGAINSMIVPAAKDLAKYGIRVMGVSPGFFQTPIYDHVAPEAIALRKELPIFPKRMGKPTEFAGAVRFCIENDYMNAQIIRVDAGAQLR